MENDIKLMKCEMYKMHDESDSILNAARPINNLAAYYFKLASKLSTFAHSLKSLSNNLKFIWSSVSEKALKNT